MENFSLMGAAPKISASSERSVINSHASTLNTLVAQGRTKRATRTSTSYGEGVKSKHISLSVLGNGHPSKFIGMERGLIGNRTACTKERFLIVVDTSVARHDALPPHADVPNAQRWTWLPLTSLQATIFGWEDVLNNPAGWKGKASDGTDDAEDAEASEEGIETEGPLRGYPMTLPDGVPSRVRYVVARDGAWVVLIRITFLRGIRVYHLPMHHCLELFPAHLEPALAPSSC